MKLSEVEGVFARLESTSPADLTPAAFQDAERAKCGCYDAALANGPFKDSRSPLSAADHAELAAVNSEFGGEAFIAQLVIEHAMAVRDKNPGYATIIRTRGLRQVRQVAGVLATQRDHGEPRQVSAADRQAPIAAAILRGWQGEIFACVRDQFPETAKVLASIEGLDRRLEALRAKRAEHEREEVERIERDRVADEQRKADEAAALRARIVEYFIANPYIAGTRRVITVGGQARHMTGLEISELAKNGTASEYAAVAALHEGLTHELRDRVLADRRADKQREALIAWFRSQRTREWSLRGGYSFSGPAIAAAIETAHWSDDSMYIAAKALRKAAA